MAILVGRQSTFDGSLYHGSSIYYNGSSYWYTREGQIVRWSVFFGLLGSFILFIIVARVHAKRRLKKGIAPLAYHRWLLSRRDRAIHEHKYRNPQVYYTQNNPNQYQYGMHPMPPPVYDANAPMPPTYQPPAGATKVDPTQWRSEPTRRPGDGEPSPSYQPPAASAPSRA